MPPAGRAAPGSPPAPGPGVVDRERSGVATVAAAAAIVGEYREVLPQQFGQGPVGPGRPVAERPVNQDERRSLATRSNAMVVPSLEVTLSIGSSVLPLACRHIYTNSSVSHDRQARSVRCGSTSLEKRWCETTSGRRNPRRNR